MVVSPKGALEGYVCIGCWFDREADRGSATSARPGEAKRARRLAHRPVAARRRSDSNNGQFNDLAIPTS